MMREIIKAGFKGAVFFLFFTLGCARQDHLPAIRDGQPPLGPDELSALLSGGAFAVEKSGTTSTMEFYPAGEYIEHAGGNERDMKGWWNIDKEGRLCTQPRKWGERKKECAIVFLKDDEYHLYSRDGSRLYSMTLLREGASRHHGRTRPRSVTKNVVPSAQPAVTKESQSPISGNPSQEAPAAPLPAQDKSAILRSIARDCPGCNLARANLAGADLAGADLSGANLSGADLSRSQLKRANLQGANLSGAGLAGADLRGAFLQGANLYGADLTGANLNGADLAGANLTDARMDGENMSLPRSRRP